MSGRSTIETTSARVAGNLRRSIGEDLAALRRDAGLTRAEVARAARLHPSSVGRIEAGRIDPELETMCRIATVLGHEPSIKLFPMGPPLRDRFQAPMLEAFLSYVTGAWTRSVEVPVTGTVSGVIDCVLCHPIQPLRIAVEVQSEIRRAEAVLRRAADTAAGLARLPLGATLRGSGATGGEVSRLLVLRSTIANRATVRELAATFAAAYPARIADALAALRDPTVPWPGPAIIWVHLHGRTGNVMERAPRGVLLGR